jgi:hypothetical protein
MLHRRHSALSTLSLFVLLCAAQAAAPAATHSASARHHHSAKKAAKKDNHKPIAAAEPHNAALWSHPGDISISAYAVVATAWSGVSWN